MAERPIKRRRSIKPTKTKAKRQKRRRLEKEAITDDEIAANKRPQYCYCLTTASLSHPYIGYTVNPERRHRQHKREITGGARRTAKMKGDVQPFLLVSGFLCQRDALQFEWAWNQGRKARRRSKLTRAPADSLRIPSLFEDEEGDHIEEKKTTIEEVATKNLARKKPTPVEPKGGPGKPFKKKFSPPLQKLVGRLFEVLACAKWTNQAIPVLDPRRRALVSEMHIHWSVDPRPFGIHPDQFKTAFPCVHHLPRSSRQEWMKRLVTAHSAFASFPSGLLPIISSYLA